MASQLKNIISQHKKSQESKKPTPTTAASPADGEPFNQTNASQYHTDTPPTEHRVTAQIPSQAQAGDVNSDPAPDERTKYSKVALSTSPLLKRMLTDLDQPLNSMIESGKVDETTVFMTLTEELQNGKNLLSFGTSFRDGEGKKIDLQGKPSTDYVEAVSSLGFKMMTQTAKFFLKNHEEEQKQKRKVEAERLQAGLTSDDEDGR